MNQKVIYGVVLIVGILLVGWLLWGGDSSESTLQDEFSQDEMMVAQTGSINLENAVYEVDSQSTVVNWEGRKTLIKDYVDRGTIAVSEGSVIEVSEGAVSGNIVFDISTISATETGSGGGQSALANHLKSADFFDAETFPTATYKITGLSESEGQSNLVGDLTIKGITHEVSMPVTVVQSETSLVVKALTVLDRTMWDIRYGSDKFFDNLKDNVIDDNFTVSFELIAVKK